MLKMNVPFKNWNALNPDMVDSNKTGDRTFSCVIVLSGELRVKV